MLLSLSLVKTDPIILSLSRKLQNKVFSSQLASFSVFEASFEFRAGFFFNFVFRSLYFFETTFLLVVNPVYKVNLAKLNFFFHTYVASVGKLAPFFFILNFFNSTYLRASFFPRLVKQIYSNVYKQLNH